MILPIIDMDGNAIDPYTNEMSRMAAKKKNAPQSILTSREVETLYWVSNGLTSYEIADALCLSRETIETHRKKIMRKLNANNIVQAVAVGFRKNIIK